MIRLALNDERTRTRTMADFSKIVVDAHDCMAYTGRMKLSDYMTLMGLDDAALAERLGVDRTTVLRLRTGKTAPSWKVAARLAEVSLGAVTPNDFLSSAHDVRPNEDIRS